MKKKTIVEKVAKRLGVRPQALAQAWVLHASKGDKTFVPWGIEPTRGKFRGIASYDLRIEVKDEAEWLCYARSHIASTARQVAGLAFRSAFGRVPCVLRDSWANAEIPDECWDHRREGDGWAHHAVRQACWALRDRVAAQGGWAMWSVTPWAYGSDTIAAVIPVR